MCIHIEKLFSLESYIFQCFRYVICAEKTKHCVRILCLSPKHLISSVLLLLLLLILLHTVHKTRLLSLNFMHRGKNQLEGQVEAKQLSHSLDRQLF